MYDEEDFLQLSGLQHIAYCERQWALIHIEQMWSENFDTVHGQLFHERAHLEGYSLVKGFRSERGYRLISRGLGIVGVADVVEIGLDPENERFVSVVRPVEYKVGKPKIEDWDRIQLCAQALCLEEMLGCTVNEGYLFYGATRHRERVIFEDNLRKRVETLAARAHELFHAGKTPKAKVMTKCKRCSLAESCLPEMFSNDVRAYWEGAGFEKVT